MKKRIFLKMAALMLMAGAVVLLNGGDNCNSIRAAEENYYLAVYTTTTSYYTAEMVAAGTGNCPREAESVYLALSKDGTNYTVLNNGSGVAFASTGSSLNPLGSGRIKEPRVFKNENGFEIVAEDSQNKGKYYDFYSYDGGVHYYEQQYENSVPHNYVLPEPIEASHVKGFPDDLGLSLGNAIEISKDEYVKLYNSLGNVFNTGIEPVNINVSEGTPFSITSLPKTVTASYSDGSKQSFPVEWNINEVSAVSTDLSGTYTVTGTVKQTKYLNKLKELNGSNNAEDDPDNVNDNYPDNCDPESGEVYYDSTKYIDGLADPHIFYDEKTDNYYCTGSYFPETSTDKAGILYDRVVVRRSKTLEGLQSSSNQVTVWKVGNQNWYAGDSDETGAKGYRNIWAPEIHRVGDYWTVYFTEAEKQSDSMSIRCHCLVLDGDIDPIDTALSDEKAASQWKDYQMQPWSGDSADNYREQRSEVPFTSTFCLDMTYFEDQSNGQAYVVWAGKPSLANGGGSTDLFIAEVNKDKPWELTSGSTRLSWSQYGWEEISYFVNEGPTVMQKDGRLYLCYSASGTGSEYAIGMLTAECGDDLLDYSKWTKNPYPVLTSKDVNGEEGPGHNSFTVDEDGNVIFVYHARPTSHNYRYNGNRMCGSNNDALTDPCRHARLKRVHWQTDGTPILKMTYEDELTVDNSLVNAVITVSKSNSVTPSPAIQTSSPAGSTVTLQPGAVGVTTNNQVNTEPIKVSVMKPAKVKKLTAKVNAKKIKLSWKKSKGASKYLIYYSLKKKGGYKLAASVKKNSYIFNKGKKGKTYYFKLKAKSGSENSAFSAVIKVKIK